MWCIGGGNLSPLGARRWCSAIREMVYKTVGFCAVTLTEQNTSHLHIMLTQHPNLLTNTLFSNIEYLHPGQMRSMVHFAFSPLLRHCPPELLSTAVGTEVADLFARVYPYAKSRWQHIAQSGTTDKDQEIEQERALRDLTRTILTVASNMFGPPPNEAEQLDGWDPKLRAAILGQERLTFTVIVFVIAALEWNDSNSKALAHRIGRTMSVALAGRPTFHALIGGEMFKVALHAALSAFGSGSMVKEKESADPSLIREVYIALGSICPYPRQLFLGLPGSTPQLVAQLEAHLMQETSAKAQKTLIKDFFAELELDTLVRRKKLSSVPELPEQLLMDSNAAMQVTESWGKVGNSSADGAAMCALFAEDL